MDAHDYLKTKDVFWINLDGPGEPETRRVQWYEHVDPLFNRHSYRISGINGATDVSFQQATDMVRKWYELWEKYEDSLFSIANKPPGKNWREATAKANVAIRLSHLKAIRAGLAKAGHRKSFLVAEDDIMPRNSLFSEEVPPPPDGFNVAIWSGGLPMAGVGADSTKFKRKAPHKWVRVTPVQAFNTLGAGLYEMTPAAASYIISQVERNPISFDHAWGFALRDLKVFRMTPQLFAQVGPSIRNGRDRAPELNR